MGPLQINSSHLAKNFDACGDMIGGGQKMKFFSKVVPCFALNMFVIFKMKHVSKKNERCIFYALKDASNIYYFLLKK